MSTLDPLDVAHLHELIGNYKDALDLSGRVNRMKARMEIVNFFRGHDAALQARIDELETQLFIERAEPALSLFEQLGLAALPAFPSVRPNQIESKS